MKLNIRGNPHSLGPVVQRGFITVLSQPDEKPYLSDGSGRLAVRRDIANHPLADARDCEPESGSGTSELVLVNTPDNFGVMGDKPSNPELLEYLAVGVRQPQAQSIKWLQRDSAFGGVSDKR